MRVRRERVHQLARAVGGGSGASRGNAVSSVAETAASRLRNASPGSPYLNEIVSPCSVSFRRPAVARGGCARIAAQVGPPPRPVAAAAAVEDGQLDAALAGELGEPLLRAVDLPVAAR